MAHKGQENLISLADRTDEEKHKIAVAGGIASGEVRKEKATMKKTLEMMLSTTNSKGNKYSDNIALGLIANAIDKTKGGNPASYKLIAQMLGELDFNDEGNETPVVNINVVDNSNLEKALYENNENE